MGGYNMPQWFLISRAYIHVVRSNKCLHKSSRQIDVRQQRKLEHRDSGLNCRLWEFWIQ